MISWREISLFERDSSSCWASHGQDERCIFWLNGRAGTGKSTIARTIAHKYYNKGRLGASFFFESGGGDVIYAANFFTTIARQLAKQSDIVTDHICKAISRRGDIGNKCFKDHWTHLILASLLPLRIFPASTALAPAY